MSDERAELHPLYRAGFLDGAASRQAEIDRLEDEADRLYAAAFNDTRRPLVAALTGAVDAERYRQQQLEAPSSVTPAEALESWGITPGTPAAPQPARHRRPVMSTRTITGNLAADLTRATADLTRNPRSASDQEGRD